MEIRRCNSDVSQAWHTKHMPILFKAGDGQSAKIGFGLGLLAGERIREDAEPLKEISADIRTLVTGDAAIGLEQLITLLLIRRNSGSISMKIAIKSGIGRDQRLLK